MLARQPGGVRVLLASVEPSQHPTIVYLASLGSRASRNATVGALRRIFAVAPEWFTLAEPNPAAWTWERMSVLRSRLAERFSPSSGNASLAALRGVLRAAMRLGHMTRDAFFSATEVDPVRGSRPKPGRAVGAEERAKLFAACIPPTRERDAAILALLYGCGLRRAELAALRISDVEADSSAGVRLVVRGKGNKTRHVPIGAHVRPHLEAWLAASVRAVGPLFYRSRLGKADPEPLSSSGVWRIVAALVKRAGLTKATPHDLRRSFASDLIDAGADLVTVAGLMGHADVSTTQGYDRRGERAARAAVELVKP